MMISFAASCEWLMITSTACLPVAVSIISIVYQKKSESGSDKKSPRAEKRNSDKPLNELKTPKKAHVIILADNDEIVDYEISNG